MDNLNAEEILRCFEAVSTFQARPEIVSRDLERVKHTMTHLMHGGKTHRSKIIKQFAKSRLTKVAAAAAIIIGVIVCFYHFGVPVDGVSTVFAETKKALNNKHFMHKILVTKRDGTTYRTENWYSFKPRTVLVKYEKEGECFKISSLNYDTMESIVYDPSSGKVTVSYRLDVNTMNLPATSWSVIENYVRRYERPEGKIVKRKIKRQGRDVDVYYLSMDCDSQGRRRKAEFLVDSESHLPTVFKRKFWTGEGQLILDQLVEFDFPESAPKDIYELGVPVSAEVVFDSHSRDLSDKKKALLQEDTVWQQQKFHTLYSLENGQILKLIPQDSIRPRRRIDEIHRTISQLEGRACRLGTTCGLIDNKGYPEYTLFYWDEKILNTSRPIFRGAVTLETAFKRIIDLSRFEYRIRDDFKTIQIAGDWVIQRGTPKEEVLRALEKIVQENTNRSIRFEKHQVEREVIVVRGRLQFTPLSGTYNDSWIHVFSDKLDPDERGGGASGASLDKFLSQCLTERLDMQIVNLAESSADQLYNYGTHMSSYLRKLPAGTEKTAKLKMLLSNLSKQTSLTFTKRRQMVDIWHVVEGK